MSSLGKMRGWAWAAIGTVAGIAFTIWATWTFWFVAGHLRRRRAGPPPLRAARRRIWEDPGPAELLDLASGPGGPHGAPAPPFHFIEEHASGTSPCVSVRDAHGRVWRVKWGAEVRSEPFACRIAWAAGFFVETNYFVERGRILGARDLAQASSCIAGDGAFNDACFELDDPRARKLFDEHGWAWNDNPFVGTRELNGLKILHLLLSNWDNKDVRDVARGSNTAIFEYALPDGSLEARYLVIDWGGSMGAWGSTVLSRGKWDAQAFAAQSADFVRGVDDRGHVTWGYTGQRTLDAVADLTRDDALWLHRRIGRLTDEQIHSALAACGAALDDADAFTRALRCRIDQLGALAQ